MRRAILPILLLLPLALAFAREPESLDQLKERAQTANPASQPKLFLEVAGRQRIAATEAYQKNDFEHAQAAIAEVALYGEKAGAAAITSRKHLKESEIRIRDMIRKLEALRQELSYDDREPVRSAIERLEKVRQQLLNAMFGPKS